MVPSALSHSGGLSTAALDLKMTKTEQTKSEKVVSEIIAIYQTVVGDITFLKSELWKVTNYCLLLLAAIVAVAKIIDPINCIKLLIFIITALAILISGIILLCHIIRNLEKGRKRLKYIIKNEFSGDVRNALKAGEDLYNAGDKPNYLWLFISVLVLSFFIVSWILWHQYNQI